MRLHPVERDFVARSDAADRAGLVSVRRRTRRLRVLVAALSALLLVAVGTVVVATNLRGQAVDARQLSLSRQLATSSDLAVSSDPRRAALLALGAWQAAPTVEARSALLATAADAFRGTMTPAHTGPVSAVAMSGDGRVAASGGLDGTLRLWDMRTRHEVARLRETGGWIRSVSMSSDGALMMAVDTRNGRAELWDVPNRRVLHAVPEYTIDGAVSPDGRTFAAVVSPGVVVVRDTTTFTERSRYPATLSQRTVFSPDGALIATTDRNDIVLTRAADGIRVTTLSGHTDSVSSIAFTGRAGGCRAPPTTARSASGTSRPEPACGPSRTRRDPHSWARSGGTTDWSPATADRASAAGTPTPGRPWAGRSPAAGAPAPSPSAPTATPCWAAA
jgi:WD40 repeat protein